MKYFNPGFRIWLPALPLFYFELYMVITLAASTGEYINAHKHLTCSRKLVSPRSLRRGELFNDILCLLSLFHMQQVPLDFSVLCSHFRHACGSQVTLVCSQSSSSETAVWKQVTCGICGEVSCNGKISLDRPS